MQARTSRVSRKYSSKPAPWMPKPENVTNCPEGLEYLTVLDQVFVEQQFNAAELMSGIVREQSYILRNNRGEKIYCAQEYSDVVGRAICAQRRMFDMKITDRLGNLVLTLFHPLACDYSCCPCCFQSIRVFSASGTLLGKTVQKCNLWLPRFVVKNANKTMIFRIKSESCTCGGCCCGSSDVRFKIINVYDKSVIGYLSKYWPRLAKEVFPDADNFGVSFPKDLDVKMKAVLLGACILIDYMFFETNSTQSRAILAAMIA